MKPCTPAIFIAAIFTALVVLDLIGKNYKDIGFHIAGGIFSVIGLYTACELGGEWVAWVLLSIPFVFLIIGLGLIWIDSQKEPKAEMPVQRVAIKCPCRRCGDCPCSCRRLCPGGGLKPTTPTETPTTSKPPPEDDTETTYWPPPPPSPPFGCPAKKA
jgi:hypothetical protein